MSTVRRFCLASALLALSVWGCDSEQPLQPQLEAAAVGAPGLRAPSGTDARPSNSSTIAITWTDNSTNEAGFRIERSATSAGPWATAGTTGANVTSFSDGGRIAEQQVCYRVLAVKRNGDSSPSNTDCSVPPAGPTSLTATALDQQTIALAWTDNSSVEQSYEVERATAAGGPFSGVASVPANTTSYRQSGLTTNTTYWYRVRPNSDFGYGDYSNVASATPFLAPPSAPSGTNTSPYYGVAIDVSWVDNASNEDGFRIERSVDGGATWVAALSVGRDVTAARDYGFQTHELPVCYRIIAFNTPGDSPPSNIDCTAQPAAPSNLTGAGVSGPAIELSWTDNSAVEDGYEVKRWDGVGAYIVIALLPANSTTYRDGGVTSDVAYSYLVRATRDGGWSDYSNTATAIVATVPPAAPSGAGAFPNSSSSITVTWVDNATNEAGYRVERSSDGGVSWVAASTTGGTSFSDQGLPSEQPVCYRVIAFNNQGDSPPSNTACTTPPAAPTGLVAVPGMSGTIDLSWTDNSNVEDGYQVLQFQFLGYQCDDYGNCWEYWDYAPIATLGPNTTSYRDSGLNSGQSYSYFVVTLKDGGQSDWSNEASATAP